MDTTMDAHKLVLLIDDEQDFLEIMSTKLQAVGLSVETALDGEEGLAKIKALKPDLVVLDMAMPGMTGADMILKVKDDPEIKNTKVVFLSSVGIPAKRVQDLQHAMSIGAVGYMEKTADLNKNVSEILSYLE
ncbi:MAG: response regulator [Patescibacteria group bacterium]